MDKFLIIAATDDPSIIIFPINTSKKLSIPLTAKPLALDVADYILASFLRNNTIYFYDFIRDEGKQIPVKPTINPILKYSVDKSFIASTEGNYPKLA